MLAGLMVFSLTSSVFHARLAISLHKLTFQLQGQLTCGCLLVSNRLPPEVVDFVRVLWVFCHRERLRECLNKRVLVVQKKSTANLPFFIRCGHGIQENGDAC